MRSTPGLSDTEPTAKGSNLAKSYSKQNPSSNDGWEEVYMEEKRGFSSIPLMGQKNNPRRPILHKYSI